MAISQFSNIVNPNDRPWVSISLSSWPLQTSSTHNHYPPRMPCSYKQITLLPCCFSAALSPTYLTYSCHQVSLFFHRVSPGLHFLGIVGYLPVTVTTTLQTSDSSVHLVSSISFAPPHPQHSHTGQYLPPLHFHCPGHPRFRHCHYFPGQVSVCFLPPLSPCSNLRFKLCPDHLANK